MPMDDHVMTNEKAERVRRLSGLHERKRREKTRQFLIEGPQSIREALTWMPDIIQDIYVQVDMHDDGFTIPSSVNQQLVDLALGERLYVHPVSAQVLHHVSSDAQGIIAQANSDAFFAQSQRIPSQDYQYIAAFWQVRDPGNAGTVIRSADAAGCSAVILVSDCVDITNPKVIRSTTGSLFHLPIVTMSEAEYLRYCTEHDITIIAADIYGTEEKAPQSLPDLIAQGDAVDGSLSILFGNEARGLPQSLLEASDIIASIPIYGKAESLNLGTSAAVMLMSVAMSSRVERI